MLNRLKLQQSLIRLVCLLASLGALAPNASALITLDSVYVGDIGNPNDSTGYGGVGYGYSIGKYEVTFSQYCAFLNAVAATDTYSLYNWSLGGSPNGGISRSGVSGSYTYSVTGSGNRPVVYVSWFDAARFSNWLQNGQPTGGQNASTTERGAYTLDGAMSGVGFTRNAGATYGLPSENEWYKAAYYQPAAKGGDSDGYWRYPTRSNTQPNSRNGSATDPNSANYYYDDGMDNGYNGGYAVNNSTNGPAGDGSTDVGAFSLAASFYGTFDQGGNAWEWNDAVIGSHRGGRGGSWAGSQGGLLATLRLDFFDPSMEANTLGFRIVVVPEPGAGGLLALGVAVAAWKWKRAGRAMARQEAWRGLNRLMAWRWIAKATCSWPTRTTARSGK